MKQPTSIITPQWQLVKEELLTDYYELVNRFANYQALPSSGRLLREWKTYLLAFIGKIRAKWATSEKYAAHANTYDLFVRTGRINTSQLIDLTFACTEWVEDCGLQKVEKEYNDPYEAFALSYPD